MSAPELGCADWGFRLMPVEERTAHQRELGFTVVEIAAGDGQPGHLPPQSGPSDRRRFREAHRANGLEPRYAAVPGDFALTDRQALELEIDRVCGAIAGVADCGASVIHVTASTKPVAAVQEASWPGIAEALDRCQARATQLGVTLTVETLGHAVERDGVVLHEHGIQSEPAALARLLRQMPPEMGLLWDPANVKAAMPDDPSCLADVVRGRVVACHLKDWRREGDGWVAVAPGEGDLDLLALLARAAYDGVCLVEYENPPDVVDGTRRGLELLQAQGGVFAH
jgi:sugar phosphate isomerase/epimerase